jgi:hypothetical protein
MGHNIPCPPQKSKIAQLNMSILCLSVNCLTIVRHYRHSWHVATHHWHSYRQPLKYQLTTQINNTIYILLAISFTDKVWHVRHSKMLLSIVCRRKKSQLRHVRRHVGDMFS